MNQEQYTPGQLAALLALKGYDCIYQLYSTEFDFRDKLGAGLRQVETELAGKREVSSFSFSCYPIWMGEDKPHVNSYFLCSFLQGQLLIDKLEMTFNNGRTNFDHQILYHPTIDQIPNRTELKQKLSTIKELQKIKKKGIKR